MKMQDIINEANFEMTPQQRKLAELGRVLMDQAASTKDDALSVVMSRVGSTLTDFGTLFGPKNLGEVVKKSSASPEVIKKLLAYAEQIQQQQAALTNDHKQGGLDDTDPDEFAEPDDAEDTMAADQAMRARRK